MAHFLTGDEKYRDLIYDDDYRSDPITRRDPPSGYRFGRTHGKRARARIALSRVNGYLKKHDQGYRQCEAASHAARTRASRYSLRSAERQLGSAQIPADRAFAMMQWAIQPINSDSSFRVERHMRQLSFTASVLVSLLRNAARSLVTFLSPSWDGPVRKYRPEDHYMRGPGPKWREKHFIDRASAGGT